MRESFLGPFLAAALAATLLSLSAGPALADHVQCGDVITQDTTLDSDLNCSGDGLVIGADDVRLDLAGHAVTTTGHGADGISNPGFDRVVTENGNVSSPNIAIALGAVADNVLRDLSVYGRSGAVVAEGFVRGRIERSAMAGNGPIRLSAAEDSAVAENRINGDLGSAIYVVGDGNQITDNVADANSGIGVAGSRNLIARNEATLLHGTGVAVSSGTHDVIEDNVLGAGSAFWARDLTDSRVSRNLGRTWYEYAFVLDNSSRIVMDHNVGEGLWLTGSDDNRLVRNRLSHGWSVAQFGPPGFDGVSGVVVDSKSAGNTLLHNVAAANEGDGLQVDNIDTRLVGNVANDNGDLGIDAVPGVKGAGNRASGNLNPAQCVPDYLCSGKGKPRDSG
jgi:Periplasmic copper-binding protein (NosD)